MRSRLRAVGVLLCSLVLGAGCSDDAAKGAGDTDAEIETCFTGSEGCPCAAENTCDPGLVCVSGGCVNLRGAASCGNGNLDPGEECDLGVFNADEGGCKTDCSSQRCGDGVVGSSEACDDGNNVTETCAYGDTGCTVCAADCTKVPGATSYCGDGITDIANGEACDDGNDDPNDSG